MASILDRYGIKEVADVTFYELSNTGVPTHPVLYLDTLKVSTIEQTAETTDARGGKGNPKLITWDYGKEINVSIEDALFSAKSMAIMFGNGQVADNPDDTVTRTVAVRLTSAGKLPNHIVADVYDSVTGGSARKKVYMLSSGIPSDGVGYASSGLSLKSLTDEKGRTVSTVDFSGAEATADITAWTGYTDATKAGQKMFVTYEVPAITRTIVISGDSFPGTYYVVGDTYARSDVDGADQFFQFVIPKAKVTSENTITLEAEGDPSVFNMNLTVLRPESGEMMRLVQYDLKSTAQG